MGILNDVPQFLDREVARASHIPCFAFPNSARSYWATAPYDSIRTGSYLFFGASWLKRRTLRLVPAGFGTWEPRSNQLGLCAPLYQDVLKGVDTRIACW